MGQNYQALKSLDRELAKIEHQDKPTRIFVMTDIKRGFINSVGTFVTKGRLNDSRKSISLSEEEYKDLVKRHDDIEVQMLVDDMYDDELLVERVNSNE